MSDGFAIKDVISVPGMTCQHCVMAIKKALTAVPGVKVADVDLEAKKVSVSFDPSKVELGSLIEAIEKVGYEAFPG